MRVFLVGCMLGVLSGCSGQTALPLVHQIEHMVLMETLAVDVDAGMVTVTATSSGQRSAGQTPAEPAQTVTATAGSVTMARQDIQTQGSDFVFFGNVEQILVGADLVEQGMEWLLWYVAEDPELRLESKLWVVDGLASDVMATEDVTNRLKAILNDGETSGLPVGRTAREVLVELEDYGTSVVPSLEVSLDGTVNSKGYALVRRGGLSGWITGAQAHGATLILGGGEGGSMLVDDKVVTLDHITIKVGATQNPLAVTIHAKVEATLVEGGYGQQVELGDLSLQLADNIKDELELCHFQNDYLHLVEKAELSAPWLSQWLEGISYEDVELRVTVDAKVETH